MARRHGSELTLLPGQHASRSSSNWTLPGNTRTTSDGRMPAAAAGERGVTDVKMSGIPATRETDSGVEGGHQKKGSPGDTTTRARRTIL